MNVISLPAEGTIIQGSGRSNVTCVALHSCGIASGRAEAWEENKWSGCVDYFRLPPEDAVLRCRSCGMRVHLPAYCDTWARITDYFSEAPSLSHPFR